MEYKDNEATRDPEKLAELPEFALDCLYDDGRDQAEVTVFEPRSRESIASGWITVDADVAVDLNRVQ